MSFHFNAYIEGWPINLVAIFVWCSDLQTNPTKSLSFLLVETENIAFPFICGSRAKWDWRLKHITDIQTQKMSYAGDQNCRRLQVRVSQALWKSWSSARNTCCPIVWRGSQLYGRLWITENALDSHIPEINPEIPKIEREDGGFSANKRRKYLLGRARYIWLLR